jgi:hypothetical protein
VPTTAGPDRGTHDQSRVHDAVYAYSHAAGGCAITGGAFYEAVAGGFPSADVGDYFFGDFCLNTISKLDVATGNVSILSTDIIGPVDIQEDPDGALYYLSRQSAPKVYRVRFTGESAPRITRQPASATLLVGQSVTFTVVASGTAPLHYQWRRNGVDIGGANSASYRFTSAQLSDDGAAFDVVVTNALGTATSNAAILTVTTNTRPTASFAQPVAGTTYAGGDLIQFAATASDAEDGTLPASAFTWWVNLHHDTHTHPQVLPFSGREIGLVRDPGERRNVVQCLLPHQPARDGCRRSHAIADPRREAAQGHGHAGHRSRPVCNCCSTVSHRDAVCVRGGGRHSTQPRSADPAGGRRRGVCIPVVVRRR